MYSIEECVFLVLEFHRLQHSPTATRRSFQNRFNVPVGPDAKTIRMLFAKFQRTGSVDDDRKGNVGPRQTIVTPENVAKVSRTVQKNPRKNIRRIVFCLFVLLFVVIVLFLFACMSLYCQKTQTYQSLCILFNLSGDPRQRKFNCCTNN